MEGFSCAKLSWLRERIGLSLPYGIPNHDTFGRVFAALAPTEFAACFKRWTEEIQRHSKGEITAIPDQLNLLDLTGCIVTVDALNCQKTIAEKIGQQGGDYLFALKGNHPWLYEDVTEYFDWALVQVSKGKESSSFFASEARSQEYGHGRREERRCWCIEANAHEWSRALDAWPGLRSLVLVESKRRINQSVERGVTI